MWTFEAVKLSLLTLNAVYYDFDPRVSLAICPQYKTSETLNDSIVWVVYFGEHNPYVIE